MKKDNRRFGSAAGQRSDCRTLGGGFTLIELLIVITIIALLTVAALPTVLSSINEREILDASAMVQSALMASRDEAQRSGKSSGVRLLLDPDASGSAGALAANRLVPITAAPDYNSGTIRVQEVTYNVPIQNVYYPLRVIVAYEDKFHYTELVTPTLATPPISPNYQPTSWYWNIKRGETLRLNNSSRRYNIIGPTMSIAGSLPPEQYTNAGTQATSLPILGPYPSGVTAPLIPLAYSPPPNSTRDDNTYYIILSGCEYLFLGNGRDDDGDGFIDEQCDGLDNNGDGLIDPGYNGIDDDGVNGVDDIAEIFLVRDGNGNLSYNPILAEYEPEELDPTVKTMATSATSLDGLSYTIQRKPVPSENSRETRLPANIVIDLTMLDRASSNALPVRPERSRLPLDAMTKTVDILFGPNGQVQEDHLGVNVPIGNRNLPFYHLWLCSRSDIQAPLAAGALTPSVPPVPFLRTPTSSPFALSGERRLVTLFPKTGNTVVNSLEQFTTLINNAPVYDPDAPFRDAQSAQREP